METTKIFGNYRVQVTDLRLSHFPREIELNWATLGGSTIKEAEEFHKLLGEAIEYAKKLEANKN